MRSQPHCSVRRAALRKLVAAQAARAGAHHQQQAARPQARPAGWQSCSACAGQALIPALGRQRVERFLKPQPRARHQVGARLSTGCASASTFSASNCSRSAWQSGQPATCRSSSCICSSGSSPYAAVTIRSCASSQFMVYVLPASKAMPPMLRSNSASRPGICRPRRLYRNSANCALNFFVALKSVFLAVSSVVFNISPMVRRRRPW